MSQRKATPAEAAKMTGQCWKGDHEACWRTAVDLINQGKGTNAQFYLEKACSRGHSEAWLDLLKPGAR